ncbi:MAG: sensor histidine kinase [Frankiaceae bacterium]|nr:sensor histidine kinase [Frankiaceae bacterium]
MTSQPDAPRAATVATWWPWLALPAVAASLVTLALSFDLTGERGPYVTGESWFLVPASIGFTIVAAGIWSTRPHPRGIVRLGALYTVAGLASAVALPAYGWSHEHLAGTTGMAWLSNWVWALGPPLLMGLGILLYPDGNLPGRRWRPAAVLGVVGITGLVLSGAFTPGPLDNLPSVDNPVGFGPKGLWHGIAGASFPVLMLATVIGVASLVTRFVRAPRDGDVRGQIGGFVLAAVLLVIAAVLPSGAGTSATLLAVTAGTALPATVGYAVLHQRLIDQRDEVVGLRRRVSSLSVSRRELVSEREDERAILRRELHDGLGPSLAAIGLGLRQLENAHDRAAVHALADEVQRAVGEVRRISAGLGPAVLDELGFDTALRESLATLDRFGPVVRADIGPLAQVSRATEVAVLRIVMEAATNAVRHADATTVDVCVRQEDGISLRVVDDGRGVADDARPGVGSTAMRARAEELGGRLSVTSNGHGTTVEAWLPAESR